jgi:hypothetical protein
MLKTALTASINCVLVLFCLSIICGLVKLFSKCFQMGKITVNKICIMNC